ncbi:MAG: nicotinate phosphoribosyltransferase [Acidobacteria bacterium]|nr:nicotinate phosphoribosyltransferase [Acidobacteriota bacterium]
MPTTEFSTSLITDLYQLTMAAGYFTHRCNNQGSFELFVRRVPKNRNYLLTAGLAECLEYITSLKFSESDIEYLKSLTVFKNVGAEFFDYLRNFRFTGDVWAMPEGTLVFGNEPIIRVTAPLIEAQILETYLLSTINFQTLIATKAARIVRAAHQDGKKRSILEFGTRRAHGGVAGTYAARSAYLSGFTGTSNLAAGKRFGIPVYGTAAHAWTLAFGDELTAFKKLYEVFPDTSTLLIDTYDTLKGAENACKLGAGIKGVRIDSGNLAEQSFKVREILDKAGLNQTKIVVSGDLNEFSITELIKRGAPVDTLGVGTELATSRDLPALGGVYKLVERVKDDGTTQFTAKFSSEKITYPGIKQVFRHYGSNGEYLGDTLGLANESIPTNSRPLLVPVIKNGEITEYGKVSLESSRAYAAQELANLPKEYHSFSENILYPVLTSIALNELLEEVKAKLNQ